MRRGTPQARRLPLPVPVAGDWWENSRMPPGGIEQGPG